MNSLSSLKQESGFWSRAKKLTKHTTALNVGFAVLLAFVMIASSQRTALAASGDYWSVAHGGLPYYLNAYSGGPYVKVYNGATTNDDFTLIDPTGTSNGYALEDTDGGAWNGKCIGDSGNNEFTYTTSLDTCPTASNRGGWGTNFSLTSSGCPSGYEQFVDDHTAEDLAPTGYANGDEWEITAGTTCIVET